MDFHAHFICDSCECLTSPGAIWATRITPDMFDKFVGSKCLGCGEGKLRWARKEEYENYTEDKKDSEEEDDV